MRVSYLCDIMRSDFYMLSEIYFFLNIFHRKILTSLDEVVNEDSCS